MHDPDPEKNGRYSPLTGAWQKSDNPTAQKVVALENEMPSKVDKYEGDLPGVLVAITDVEKDQHFCKQMT